MKQQIAKFLEFNGKNLVFLSKDGVYWIAVKPICEVLNIEYTRIFKNLKTDPLLGPRLAKQPMMIPDDTQPRKFVCLPEFLVYGWIFSIQSASKELQKYKMECYEILFNHFHGTITGRVDLLKTKAKIASERYKAENEIRTNPLYQTIEKLRAEEMRLGKALAENDRQLFSEQLRLFN